MSIEMQRAYEGDMAEIREDGTGEYVDNHPEDVYVDATVSDGATDAFTGQVNGQQELDLGGGADETGK